MTDNNKTKDLDRVIEDLRKKYPEYPLYQITDQQTGDIFIVRGSNWDEFQLISKRLKPGEENRAALNLIKEFVVYPEIDAQELEYNKSGDWQPGRIVALGEQITEALGYSKAFSVKKL